ncbi:MAG: hypothetical protein PHR52_09905 [Fermentimonas sp.]|nr:hypothetical protein [Fermentimonas sp.]
MKFRLLFIVLIPLSLFSQNREFVLLHDEFSYLLNTSDELYIYGDNSNYLMNKSPLSYFKGYKSLYSDNDGLVIVVEADFLGASGRRSEKEYEAVWLLKNKQLYLCKIFFWSSRQTDESTYQKMEKFTRQSFNKKTFNISAPEDIYGLMPAKWFSDTLYVKKANRILSRTWQEKPYHKLIFKKGKLVSSEIIANKTWEEKVLWKPRQKSSDKNKK